MSVASLPLRTRLESLARQGDLQAALHEVCGRFGRVTSIDIVTMASAEQRRALCFLRLESQAQESELMSSLGAFRFGSDVLVVVDLPS